MDDDARAAMPKVSVVVVTYNQEDYIARALDSVLAQQTDFPFEIEIADDCSTDRTSDICRAYAAQFPGRIHYTRNRENLGVRENYFRALRRCRAEYIADCAGDDFWVDERKLQKQADLLDANPEVGLVHTDWRYYSNISGSITTSDPDGSKKPFRKPLAKPGELDVAVHTLGILIHFCSALFRKSIFLAEAEADPWPFESPEICYEDQQLAAIYAHKAAVAYIPDVTLYYTVGQDSFSHTPDLEKDFRFNFSLIKLKQHYTERYHLEKWRIRPSAVRVARFLYSAAIILRDPDRLHDVDTFLRESGMPRPWRCRVAMFLFKLPAVGPLYSRLKKFHHYWRLKKWT